MAYSTDYRKAAISFKQSGHTFKELKQVFNITPRTYYDWLALLRDTGCLDYRNAKTRKRKISLEALEQAVREKPDLYLRELAARFNCSIAAVHARLSKLKYTYKKRRLPIASDRKSGGRNISTK